MYFLNNHTEFSLLYGTLPVSALYARAEALKLDTLVVTDINTTSAVFELVRLCEEKKRVIRPVAGVDFRNGDEFCYVCLAKTPAGFAEITRFLTEHDHAGTPFPVSAPDFSEVAVIYPMRYLDGNPVLQSHEYIGIRPSEINRFWNYRRRVSPDRLVVLQSVSFQTQDDYELHRHLRAIDKNCLLSRLPEEAQASPTDWMVPPDRLAAKYVNLPGILENTTRLLAECRFDVPLRTVRNKQVFSASAADDEARLAALAWEGFTRRYDAADEEARSRVRKELTVISDMGFCSYFLITEDIIRFAKSKGYFHIGRGSGANSVVAYCIGITDVDPIALDLYFERFINPERTSPPDFDIDFSWDDRDEIIEYIFHRHGPEHVCLLATYVTFQNRSQYRELGKVYGLPRSEIDALVDLVRKRSYGWDVPPPADSYTATILRIGQRMDGKPRQLSIHAGGILISDQPLFACTGLKTMPKGFPICHFDMYTAEDMGFAKFDILSQRGLGHIKDTVEIVRENRQIEIDIHRVKDFLVDEKVRDQLRSHETMGCFYVESPAMRQLIWKLNCDNYPTLVAASSIIRPGVASSGMMREYILRHHRPGSYTYAHPVMEQLMAETYGIMVYQEDVIKVAHYFAGLTLAEADILRRGMSGKYRSRKEFRRIEEVFAHNCRERGYPDAVWQEVWRQIESFSGYSFSKAHSASYAVESYQSLYLKAYYPLEFMVGVINNFGGFYSTEFYVHEARRWGAAIEAPDINRSGELTSILGTTIWLGWIHLQSLEKKTIASVTRQQKEGPFRSFDDFCRRVPIGLEQLLLLIRIGAFRSFGQSKKSLLWEAHWRWNDRPSAIEPLFGMEDELPVLPVFSHDPLEDAYDELELLGFPLCPPFSLIGELSEFRYPLALATDLDKFIGKPVTLLGYLVHVKSTTTRNGDRMGFGYWLDYSGEFFDTVHFPDVAKAYPLTGSGVFQMEGIVSEEFGHCQVTVSSAVKVPYRKDPRQMTSIPARQAGTVSLEN